MFAVRKIFSFIGVVLMSAVAVPVFSESGIDTALQLQLTREAWAIDREEFEKNLLKAQNKIQQLNHRIYQIEESVRAEMNGKINQLDEQLTRVSKERNQMFLQNEQLQKELRGSREALAAVEAMGANQGFGRTNPEFSQLESQVATLQTSARQQLEIIDRLKSENQSLRMEGDALRSELAASEANSQRLNDALAERLSGLTEKVTQLQTKLDTVNSSINVAEGSMAVAVPENEVDSSSAPLVAPRAATVASPQDGDRVTNGPVASTGSGFITDYYQLIALALVIVSMLLASILVFLRLRKARATVSEALPDDHEIDENLLEGNTGDSRETSKKTAPMVIDESISSLVATIQRTEEIEVSTRVDKTNLDQEVSDAETDKTDKKQKVVFFEVLQKAADDDPEGQAEDATASHETTEVQIDMPTVGSNEEVSKTTSSMSKTDFEKLQYLLQVGTNDSEPNDASSLEADPVNTPSSIDLDMESEASDEAKILDVSETTEPEALLVEASLDSAEQPTATSDLVQADETSPTSLRSIIGTTYDHSDIEVAISKPKTSIKIEQPPAFGGYTASVKAESEEDHKDQSASSSEQHVAQAESSSESTTIVCGSDYGSASVIMSESYLTYRKPALVLTDVGNFGGYTKTKEKIENHRRRKISRNPRRVKQPRYDQSLGFGSSVTTLFTRPETDLETIHDETLDRPVHDPMSLIGRVGSHVSAVDGVVWVPMSMNEDGTLVAALAPSDQPMVAPSQTADSEIHETMASESAETTVTQPESGPEPDFTMDNLTDWMADEPAGAEEVTSEDVGDLQPESKNQGELLEIDSQPDVDQSHEAIDDILSLAGYDLSQVQPVNDQQPKPKTAVDEAPIVDDSTSDFEQPAASLPATIFENEHTEEFENQQTEDDSSNSPDVRETVSEEVSTNQYNEFDNVIPYPSRADTEDNDQSDGPDWINGDGQDPFDPFIKVVWLIDTGRIEDARREIGGLLVDANPQVRKMAQALKSRLLGEAEGQADAG